MSLIRGEIGTKVDAPLSPARMDIIIREWYDSLERYTHAIKPLTVNLFSVASIHSQLCRVCIYFFFNLFIAIKKANLLYLFLIFFKSIDIYCYL